MPIIKTAIIVGSLRKESFNLKLAKALLKLGEGKIEGSILRIDDLPLFNQDLEADAPKCTKRLKSGIEAAMAIIIVTPEYNRSIPAPLKNAIDWASRPYGKNSFAHKPVSVVGTSGSQLGTACAQYALFPVLRYLDVKLMGQPEIYLQFKDGLIDESGNITSDKTLAFLKGYVEKFVSFVESAHP